MTIDEAIKYQEGILKTLPVTLGEKEKDAIKLGIEALKKIQYDRLPGSRPLYDTLPGETREQ